MRRSVKLSLVAFVSLIVLASGASVALRLATTRSEYTDTQTIRVEAHAAQVRNILWQPAVSIVTAAQIQGDEYEPRISSDGTTMVFVRGRPGSNADLFTSRWNPNGWSAPEPIESVNTPGDELGPELSRDGQSLYFYSDREGGLGGYDLWVSRLESGAWGSPSNLGPAINSPSNEYGPSLSPDGKRLFFASNRLRPDEPQPTREAWSATVREARGRHDYDLYTAGVSLGATLPAHRIPELSTLADEGAPTVSPGGDFLYFASDRTGAGGMGGFDLYRVRLFSDTYSTVENLGSAINSTDDDLDPALSSDGFRLFFSSNRERPVNTATTANSSSESEKPVSQPRSEPLGVTAPRPYTLWGSTSREVILEHDSAGSRAALLELWNALWPWLLPLLFTALLVWTLAALLRSARWRRRFARLSLLAQCLLISIALHILIGGLLAIWQVGNAIGEYIGHAGGNRVVLASSGLSGAVSGQVRSAITSAQTPIVQLSGARATLDTSASIVKPLNMTPVIQSASADAGSSVPLPVESAVGPNESMPTLSAVRMTEASLVTPALPAPSPTDAPVADPAPASTQAQARVQVVPQASLSPTALPEIRTADIRPGERTASPDSSPATSALPSAQSNLSRVIDSPISFSTLDTRTLSAPRSNTPMTTAVPHMVAPDGAEVSEARLENVTVSASRAEATPHALPAIPAGDTPARTQINPRDSSQSSTREQSSIGSLGALFDTISVSEPGTSDAAPRSSLGSAASRLLPREDRQLAPSRLPVLETSSNQGQHDQGEPNLASSTTPALPQHRAGVAPSSTSGKSPDLRRSDTSALPASGPASSNTQPVSALTDQLFAPRTTSDTAGESRANTANTPPPWRDGIASFPPVAQTAVALPAEEAPPVPKETFEQRAPEVRADVLGKMGGSIETERAVGLALDWFVRHQEPDGRWTGRAFDDHCGACGGKGEFDSDAAMTGITLLCFLGAGHTHTSDGPYKEVVSKAMTWLLARQSPSGDVRQGETMYSQTVATVALCEALAMTRDPKLTRPTRRAVAFLDENALKRTPRASTAKAVSDNTSVLGWQVMAIKSARRAGIDVSSVTFDAAKNWLEYVRDAAKPGQYSYRKGEAPTPAMTAEAMFVRQLLGHTRDEAAMKQSAQFILTAIPKWLPARTPGASPADRDDAAPSTYYWYYATLALFQHQGESWQRWNEALVPALLSNQHTQGPAAGSWDPQDQWSRMGGRVYQTAICTLSLEVYYRYKPDGVELDPAEQTPPLVNPSASDRR